MVTSKKLIIWAEYVRYALLYQIISSPRGMRGEDELRELMTHSDEMLLPNMAERGLMFLGEFKTRISVEDYDAAVQSLFMEREIYITFAFPSNFLEATSKGVEALPDVQENFRIERGAGRPRSIIG